MKSIPIPAIDRVRIYDAIRRAKQAPRDALMISIRSDVLNAYEVYLNAAPEVGALLSLPLLEPEKAALRHAYTVETRPMTELRIELLDGMGAALCPLCGLGETSTLDHYLPKERFAEFSVLPNNLIPCCARCNTLKRDKILVEGTQVRAFLHSYYDVVPVSRFVDLQVEIVGDALALSFDVVKPLDMEENTFFRLRSHFNKLRLADRYSRSSLELLGDQRSAFDDAYAAGAGLHGVREALLSEAGKYNRHGPNHWRIVLFETLAAYDEFCDGGFVVIRH